MNGDLVPESGQMICRGESARSCTDDQHLLAGTGSAFHRPAFLDRLIAQKSFHCVNANSLIQLCSIASAFTWVVTDAAVDRRHRVVLHELLPGFLVSPFFSVIQPGLDVLPSWAGVVARRQAIHIHRFHGAPVPRMVGQACVRIERDGKRFAVHRSPLSQQSIEGDVVVCNCLDPSDGVGVRWRTEQMREPVL